MTSYQALLECYQSGQISERQWQEHLKDEVFIAWLRRRGSTVFGTSL